MTIQNLNQPTANPDGSKKHYRDEYIVEEDQMGDSGPQDWLMRYLVQVLEELFRAEKWMVTANRNMYHEALDNSEKLIVPDIAVFKGIDVPPEEQPYITSWDMRKGNKPCPPLVIEVSSSSTYAGDIEPGKKPRLYGLVGVKEYFAYDPNRPQVWPRRIGTRLLGWQYNAQGQPQPIKPNQKGWLWSDLLESWLVADGLYLRLYDRNEQLRLTAEAAKAEVLRLESNARQEAEQRAGAAEQQLAELQRQLEKLRQQQG